MSTKAVILVCRGHTPRDQGVARSRFAKAAALLRKKHPGLLDSVRMYIVDDSSAAKQADVLLTRLGVYHDRPFLIMLDNFVTKELKYLSPQRGVPTETEMAETVAEFIRGELKPAILGQPRPAGDKTSGCSDLYEVVTDSFDELVLRCNENVLIEGYTSKCDACKALAPRVRMLAFLARKHFSSGPSESRLRVARMDILDNDRPITHMPEKWTPSLRLFLFHRDRAQAASAPAVSGPASVLYSFDAATGTGSSDAAAVAIPGATIGGGSAARMSTPSLLDVLLWLQHQTGGRLAVSEQARQDALALEAEAVVLERAYDQVLEYTQLWQMYREAVGAAVDPAVGATASAAPGVSEDSAGAAATAAADAAIADELQRRVIAAYRFLVHEAGAGGTGAAQAVQLLQSVADLVEAHDVAGRIDAAFGEGSSQELMTK